MTSLIVGTYRILLATLTQFWLGWFFYVLLILVDFLLIQVPVIRRGLLMIARVSHTVSEESYTATFLYVITPNFLTAFS